MRRDVFQAIADPTRRAIIGLIALQAMTPNAIAENFNSTRQAVSKHLRILTECELVNIMLAAAGFNFKRMMNKWKSSFWLFFQTILFFIQNLFYPKFEAKTVF